MKVPFGTLTLTDRAKKLIAKSLDEEQLSMGDNVRQFEKEFAEFSGTKYAVAVSSGTDAITIALSTLYEVLNAKREMEVIVPALTFIASSNAILQAGFIPKFIDIDINTLNIDVSKIPENITENVIAILPVHLMGKPTDMDKINFPFIEDAAEAHGALYKGRKVGTFGMAGCYSLYVAHIISSIEGGMVVTDDPQIARLSRSLRNHGRLCDCINCVINSDPKNCVKRKPTNSRIDPRFIFPRIGYSAKMNELEAAIGLGTIEIADEILKIRRSNYYYYAEELQKFEEYFHLIKEGPNEKIGPHAFPIIVRENAPFTRNEIAYHLQKNEIDSRTLFGSIPTQSNGYRWMNYEEGDFPVAEYVGKRGFHIGIHQGINEEQREYVVKVITEFIEERSLRSKL